ncbi:MAG TPA: VOC family protein [Anaerolineales bacterium]|nr:VOC family protein [Anaerolineales bacterium]
MNPSELEVKPQFSIHPKTRVGEVSLSVVSLERQIAFYRDVVGLSVLHQDAHSAALGAAAVSGGAGRPLVRLTEEPTFKRYRGVTGLYHFAVLFPSQRELARAMGRLIALQYPNSPTDHIMTKTTYLDDPEGNGMELYAESPEDGAWSMADGQYVTRRADGSISSGREPLDVEALLSHLMKEDRLDSPVPSETRVGHVHLHVRDVEEAVSFYHGVLGFDLQGNARAFRMAFVSAGGYHHHIGLNTWQGEGAPVAPPDALGMRYFSVVLPDETELERLVSRLREKSITMEESEGGVLVRDPSQNGVLLTSGQG